MTQENLPQIVPQPGKEPLEMDERGLYRITSQAHELRVAKLMLETGAAPASMHTPAQVCLAIQTLTSLGLNWRVALRQCGYINGSFMLYGDLPLALARQSGELEMFEEFTFCLGKDDAYERQCFANSNLHKEAFGAVCRLKRRGQEVHEASFDKNRAMQAGLWGRKGPWSSYSRRMLVMRARSEALKNVFSDCLMGVAVQEFDGDQAQGDMTPREAQEHQNRAIRRLEDLLKGHQDNA